MRLPIGICPLLTRWPPNQRTATLERFMIPISAGMASTKIRLTRRPVAVRLALAVAKRRSSSSVRTKARITRTPVICSRNTWLIRSIFTCIDLNWGTATNSMVSTSAAIRGTATTRRTERVTSSCRAMITPPTIMIGAATMSVRAICRKI